MTLRKTHARALAAAAGLAAAAAARLRRAAQDAIYVPLLTYRTGPFAGSGIPIANGMHDYLRLLNERDGGIGGVKIADRGVRDRLRHQEGPRCYERREGQEARRGQPVLDRHHLPLIPKASVDKIPILSMAYGLSASARGDIFPGCSTRRPPTGTGSVSSSYIGAAGRRRLEKLKGKKIGYIYFDGGFGKEPIPLFEQLAKDFGFDLKLYPVAPGDMQNQSSHWLAVRRDRPDYMVTVWLGRDEPDGHQGGRQDQLPDGQVRRVWWPAARTTPAAAATAPRASR